MDGPWRINVTLPRSCDQPDPRSAAPKCQQAFYDFLMATGKVNKVTAYQMAFEEKNLVGCYEGLCACEEQLYVYSGPNCSQDSGVTILLIVLESIIAVLSLVLLVRGTRVFLQRWRTWQERQSCSQQGTSNERSRSDEVLALSSVGVTLVSLLMSLAGSVVFFHGYFIFSFHLLLMIYLVYTARVLVVLALFLMSVIWARIAQKVHAESTVTRAIVSNTTFRIYCVVMLVSAIFLSLSWTLSLRGSIGWSIVFRIIDMVLFLSIIAMASASAADVYRITLSVRDGKSGLEPGMAGCFQGLRDIMRISLGTGYFRAMQARSENLRAENDHSQREDTHQVDSFFIRIQYQLVGTTSRIFYFGMMQVLGQFILIFTSHQAAVTVHLWPLWVALGRSLLFTFIFLQWTIIHYFSSKHSVERPNNSSVNSNRGNLDRAKSSFIDTTVMEIEMT